MHYALIIYQTPEAFTTDPVQAAEYSAGWMTYAAALAEAGVMTGGAGLDGPGTATTIRFGAGVRNGDHAVEDGPFADTKEQLGGFFTIDVPDLDTAMKWAARAPLKYGGSIEVRPIIHKGAR